MPRWIIDLTGERQDEWVWYVVDDDQTVLEKCERPFPYYLHCLEDAKKHGLQEDPSFPAPGVERGAGKARRSS